MFYNIEARYTQELARLKPDDEIQYIERLEKYPLDFIGTAGHGYLVVPKEHPLHAHAHKICQYGYKGTHAVYLEEDCEASEFLNLIK